MDANYKAEGDSGSAADKQKKYTTDVVKLEAMYQECLTRPLAFVNNMRQNRDARYNYRPGKSFDGRKWTPAEGDSEVLPWRGASDLDVPLIDGYINEDVALVVQAIMSANITISGHNTKDVAFGTRATNVLKWMLEDEMTERNRETNLLANYHFERGKAVLGVQWERQVQMGYEELTLEMVEQMAQGAQSAVQQHATSVAANGGQTQGPPPTNAGSAAGTAEPTVPTTASAGAPGQGSPNVLTPEQLEQMQEVAALPMLLQDPGSADRLAELVQSYAAQLVSANFKEALGNYGDELLEDFQLSKATAKRVVNDLREGGKAKFPVPTVRWNRPVLLALAMDEDFFFPPDATDMENARAMFWREWLTEEQVRERVVSLGWDEEWVEYVIKHGKGSVGPNAVPAGAASASFTGSAQSHGRTLLSTENLYGILHCYERRTNEDNVPGIYYTVIHPNLLKIRKQKRPNRTGQPYAVSFLLDYAHGEYPFILFRREFLSRRLDDSRGAGEIAHTWQKQIKTEADLQIDRSSIATMPPLHHPKGKPPTKWGPGVRVPGSKNDYNFADLPHFDPGSGEVIKMVMGMSDWYFGRPVEGRDPVLASLMRQHAVSVWLDGWRLALTQMFQLMQQYLPDEFFYRVVGSSQGQTLHAKRDEIQGKFSLSLKFDTQRLDPEVMEAKTKAIVSLVETLDNNGITDHSKLLAVLLSWVDPDIGDTVLRPVEAATQQEAEDEQNVFAKLWAGIGVDVKPGQAYALRLKVLQDALNAKDPKTGAPINPSAQARYQQDPAFKQLVDTRVQQLQFQLEQRQNAVIGKLGAQPAQ